MPRPRRVVVIQPYVPDYRRPFFEQLERRLAAHGIELELLAGRPIGQHASRDDAADLPFVTTMRVLHLCIRGRVLRWRPVQRRVTGADLVVTELASGALDNYVLAVRPSVRMAVWGHGFATLGKPNRLDAALERWLMRRSVRFFAYTPRGRNEALAAGLSAERVTVLNNTIDTTEIQAERDALTDADVRAFATEHGLGDGPVVAFIGALDSSKRIDLLLQLGERLAARIDGFQLVVCGTGDDRDRIVAASAHSAWLRYIGRVDAAGKARLAACCSLLVNPGVVGLLAIDSFALGLPIVTTDWPFHGPEVEYLENGVTAVIARDDPDVFLAAVESLLDEPERLATMRAACAAAAGTYSMVAMVERFADGVLEALAAGVRPGGPAR